MCFILIVVKRDNCDIFSISKMYYNLILDYFFKIKVLQLEFQLQKKKCRELNILIYILLMKLFFLILIRIYLELRKVQIVRVNVLVGEKIKLIVKVRISFILIDYIKQRNFSKYFFMLNKDLSYKI